MKELLCEGLLVEDGDLGINAKPLYLVVFEGLLGHLHRTHAFASLTRHAQSTEERAVRVGKKHPRRADLYLQESSKLWGLAAGCWAVDMHNMEVFLHAYDTYSETAEFGVASWLPENLVFALERRMETLFSHPWVYVNFFSFTWDTMVTALQMPESRIATLYDPDPEHLAQTKGRVRLVDPKNFVID